ncbi:hypothetical protein CLF_110098 [Clonorchis sinensis]|uniref:Uncharacterized protein n=1 Tax=Clonorchis sinensis TaxID=79923 RepID=G7YK94_CLOSI|nr:hypothetical protein CLF_110098 [Clonorchis sinensis]
MEKRKRGEEIERFAVQVRRMQDTGIRVGKPARRKQLGEMVTQQCQSNYIASVRLNITPVKTGKHLLAVSNGERESVAYCQVTDTVTHGYQRTRSCVHKRAEQPLGIIQSKLRDLVHAMVLSGVIGRVDTDAEAWALVDLDPRLPDRLLVEFEGLSGFRVFRNSLQEFDLPDTIWPSNVRLSGRIKLKRFHQFSGATVPSGKRLIDKKHNSFIANKRCLVEKDSSTKNNSFIANKRVYSGEFIRVIDGSAISDPFVPPTTILSGNLGNICGRLSLAAGGMVCENPHRMTDNVVEATECVAPGRLMFQLLRHSRYRDSAGFRIEFPVVADGVAASVRWMCWPNGYFGPHTSLIRCDGNEDRNFSDFGDELCSCFTRNFTGFPDETISLMMKITGILARPSKRQLPEGAGLVRVYL